MVEDLAVMARTIILKGRGSSLQCCPQSYLCLVTPHLQPGSVMVANHMEGEKMSPLYSPTFRNQHPPPSKSSKMFLAGIESIMNQ
ncbi:hypothetical protein I7I50_10673 [Histoplasma capsulatum G186AR]|uniref:Uncharacterized protein n=1 Tax=Ajellomyces capsulatus TaxID=5037 RepID=A0A8H7Z9N7_AJECA|nr:hypothetical protein I7I52_01911 [Histoplasma capsulatum]QSS69393.1 hypothetical protein I7I50_10673 [Histoplasma capsulatum G186AR]